MRWTLPSGRTHTTTPTEYEVLVPRQQACQRKPDAWSQGWLLASFGVDDDAFLAYVGERLGELPAVRGVTLGGSRAEGTHRPDSDWDFSVYYRGHFDPQALRDIGWPGEVFEVVLTRAGLREVDGITAAARPDPAALREVVDASRAVCLAALTRVRWKENARNDDAADARGAPGGTR
jgi:hypothetical protein